MRVSERFLKYVSFDTTSYPNATTFPSSEKQKVLAKYLVEEMQGLGIKDAFMDEYGYVYGTIEKNIDKEMPVVAFIAHMDTAPDISGTDIKPRVVENYDGTDIVLNKEKNIVLSMKDFDCLSRNIGHDLIVTDGTTLLGGDDKAGVAEIMNLAETLLNNPDIKHGTIKIAFTPDEEVGGGTDHFNVKDFGADYAYTVDGGEVGHMDYENFNAASAKITINGTNIHPGVGKGKMVSALLIAMEIQNMLPTFENPAFTEHYEGFFHLNDMSGTVEQAKMNYMIRDHFKEKFEQKKDRMRKIVAYLNDKYGEGTVVLDLNDQYYNMKEMILPHMHIVDIAKQAMLNLGITPVIKPIRGGTDGSKLSFMGLPCPNICTGAHLGHGRYEYASIQEMEKTVEILLEIVRLYTER